jgi:DNA-binding NtrC family response regulator
MSAGRTQVISTTNSRLLTLVDCGTFLDTLYYRLNVVCVDVTT